MSTSLLKTLSLEDLIRVRNFLRKRVKKALKLAEYEDLEYEAYRDGLEGLLGELEDVVLERCHKLEASIKRPEEVDDGA
jgi:hypothetical protein